MGQCINCGKSSTLISRSLSLCLQCIRQDFKKVYPHIIKVHQETRRVFQLPAEIPKVPDGVKCFYCANECQIGSEGTGYCGVRENVNGQLVDKGGNLSWYYDPLPTNCVASWVCAGGTGAGYPEFSHLPGPEYGYKNLAVFYNACSFNCLFCQNWHYREAFKRTSFISPQELVKQIDSKTSCICYFGGDPAAQLQHALETSRLALKNRKNILRICWETNGSMNPAYLDQMLELSLISGGCVKFDLKAWHEKVHFALTGVSNKRTLENFKYAASRVNKRIIPPLLIASTLLVPGYVDEEEIRFLAKFIVALSPKIPYSLLAFHPQFYMEDLPTTSKKHALRALKIAQEVGLENVHLANVHLLVKDNYD